MRRDAHEASTRSAADWFTYVSGQFHIVQSTSGAFSDPVFTDGPSSFEIRANNTQVFLHTELDNGAAIGDVIGPGSAKDFNPWFGGVLGWCGSLPNDPPDNPHINNTTTYIQGGDDVPDGLIWHSLSSHGSRHAIGYEEKSWGSMQITDIISAGERTWIYWGYNPMTGVTESYQRPSSQTYRITGNTDLNHLG